MKRRLRGALLGAMAVFLGAGALVTGAGTASAATDATGGTVTLTPRSSSLTDGSPFTQVSADQACPANYQDSVSVYLVAPNGSESSIAYNLTDGAPYGTAPITANEPAASTDTTFVNSIADAFANVNATVADGTYPIHVVCGNADPANFPDRPTFTGFIDVNGSTWQPSSRPAPIATKIKLTAAPANHVQVGQTFTLTAAVTPGVAGTVQFSDGDTNPIGGPVAVVGGVAGVQVPTSTSPWIRRYNAVFVPSDQLTYAQAYSVISYAFVAAPTITVKDAGGTVLGGTPQLTPGQKITVSATGFLPATGESVRVAITDAYYGSFPAVFPTTTSDAAGSVNGYTLTVPDCISAGSHKLTLTGANTHIKITFAFTTK